MKKKVLDGHRKEGKIFIPPILDRLNINEVTYSDALMTEIVWLGYFIEKYGDKIGSKIVLDLIDSVYKKVSDKNQPYLGFLSSFNLIHINHWKEIINELKLKNIYDSITTCLYPFIRSFPKNNPLGNLFLEEISECTQEDVLLTKNIISKVFYRRDHFALVVQTIVIGAECNQGRIHVAQDMELPNLDSIFNPDNADNYNRIGSHVRMQSNMLYGAIEEKIGKIWPEYFWSRAASLEKLSNLIEVPEIVEIENDDFINLLGRLEIKILTALKFYCEQIPFNPSQKQLYETVCGLLTNQCKKTCDLILNPGLWNWDSGPILLRSLTDSYITLAWILKSPEERSKKYVEYGLGQEKLQIEHQENAMDQPENSYYKEYIEQEIFARKAWLDSQHYSFLQKVDIGNWSGKSARQMAEEAGCLKLYIHSYSPWSQATHAMWNHVGKFDVAPTENPLHKYVKVPFVLRKNPEPELARLAMSYITKTFELIMETYSIDYPDFDQHSWFLNEIEKLSQKNNT